MRFIAFEGLDGAGKSTLIAALKSNLESQGLGVYVSREPGGSPLGAEIRHWLIHKDQNHPRPKAEALLYQADRAQHVEVVIRPELAKGNWVLSDRYAASSIAFQAGGRAISIDEIKWLNEFSTGGLKPDLYVLLDLSIEESERRMKARPGELDRFESENKDFHNRVRQSYLELAKADPNRWIVLDASLSPEKLQQTLFEKLRELRWWS